MENILISLVQSAKNDRLFLKVEDFTNYPHFTRILFGEQGLEYLYKLDDVLLNQYSRALIERAEKLYALTQRPIKKRKIYF